MPVTGVEPNTQCAECKCCIACVSIDGVPTCARCDDGEHPPIKPAPTKAMPLAVSIPREAVPGRASRALQLKPAARLSQAQIAKIHDAPAGEPITKTAKRLGIAKSTVQRRKAEKETRSMSALARGGKVTRLTDAEKETIRLAPATETDAELAKRTGIPVSNLWYWRKKFRGDAKAAEAETLPVSESIELSPAAVILADLSRQALEQPAAEIASPIDLTPATAEIEEFWQGTPAVATTTSFPIPHVFMPGPAGTMIPANDGKLENHFVPAAEVVAIIDADQQRVVHEQKEMEKIAAAHEAAELHAGCATVTLTLCASSINRWWNQLELEEKADILAAHFDCCAPHQKLVGDHQ